MRRLVLAAVLAAGIGLLAGAGQADAHGPYASWGSQYAPSPFYGGYYGSPYYGGDFGSPYYGGFSAYYGNGGHDLYPHWHQTYTPYGAVQWYGTGPHDYLPHEHVVTPYSYMGRSYTPWGYTESYYPRYPQFYYGW